MRDYGDLKQQLWSFLLDEGEPHTLQFATLGPGAGTVVGESPGRALAGISAAAR